MNSQQDLDDFMIRYNGLANYNFTIFSCDYYKPKNERVNTSIFDPYNMFRHLKNLNIHDPNKKPVIIKSKNSIDVQNSTDLKDELAFIIYENVEKKDPE